MFYNNKSILQIFIITLFLIILPEIQNVNAECYTCMDNGIACLNATHFTTCYEGQLTRNFVSCPAGKYCTDSNTICQPSTSDVEPACPFVGVCVSCVSTIGRFTCLNETHYGFCYGESLPNIKAIGHCPSNYVCSDTHNEVCVPAATNKPSCARLNTTEQRLTLN